METYFFVSDDAVAGAINEKIHCPPAHQFQFQAEYFADRVLKGKPIEQPAENGLANMKVIDALYDSARQGRPVKVCMSIQQNQKVVQTMKKLRVVSVQMDHTPGDKEANFAKIRDFVQQASQQDVELISFPNAASEATGTCAIFRGSVWSSCPSRSLTARHLSNCAHWQWITR